MAADVSNVALALAQGSESLGKLTAGMSLSPPGKREALPAGNEFLGKLHFQVQTSKWASLFYTSSL